MTRAFGHHVEYQTYSGRILLEYSPTNGADNWRLSMIRVDFSYKKIFWYNTGDILVDYHMVFYQNTFSVSWGYFEKTLG